MHERHLTGDFLLAVLRSVLAQRPIHMTNVVNTLDDMCLADDFLLGVLRSVLAQLFTR